MQLNTERRLRDVSFVFVLVFLVLSGLLYYSYRKLMKSNAALSAERKNLTQEKQKLTEINKTKNKLFAMLSHDLRSPVSSLVNTLEVFKSKGDYSFVAVERSLNNIQLILNNLLKWSDMQLREGKPYFSDVDLHVLLGTILKQVQPQVTDKDIQVIASLNHTRKVVTDENYLQIVLRNVISNAAKFTPQFGFIKIETSNKGAGVQMVVRDSGVGMSESKLETIFAYPASSKGTIGEKGTGLGMTLCKELLDRIEGEIGVKSKVGVGTEVSIYLQEK